MFLRPSVGNDSSQYGRVEGAVSGCRPAGPQNVGQGVSAGLVWEVFTGPDTFSTCWHQCACEDETDVAMCGDCLITPVSTYTHWHNNAKTIHAQNKNTC